VSSINDRLQVTDVAFYRARKRAPEPHCKAWNLAFFKALHNRLPMELRSIIYAYIWDKPTLARNSQHMEGCLTGQYRGEYKKYDLVKEAPHYIKPVYVGINAALEVVEAWYKAMGRRPVFPIVQDVRQIERFVTADVFFVGIDPAKLVRRLDIEIHMKHLFASPDGRVDEDRTRAHYYLGFLHKIENKRVFELNIKLQQRTIRLNLWPLALETLEPVWRSFKNEGARVRVYWTYIDPEPAGTPLEMELDGLIENPSLDWKKDVIAILDSVSSASVSRQA
jgi:hypothetical protein